MDALRIARLIAFALAGVLVGWAYFSLMRYSLAYLGKGRSGTMRFVALALLRILLFGGGALGALLLGGWCLITYLFGFMVARTIAVGRARSAGPAFAPIIGKWKV